MKRMITILGAAILGAAAISACGSSGSSTSGSSGGEYIIGGTDDLSGPAAVYGQEAREAWTGYFDYVNAHGGIHGHKVKLIFLDDQSEASMAVANVKELLSDKVILTSGGTGDDICSAVYTFTSKAHIPEVCTAIAQDLMEPPQPYVYGRLPIGPQYVESLIDFVPVVVTKASPKVGSIHNSLSASLQFGNDVTAATKAKGWQAVGNETTDSTASPNLTGQTAALASAKANAILNWLPGSVEPTFMHTLRADGSSATVLDSFSDYQALEAVKDPNEYQAWDHEIVDPANTSAAVQQMDAALKLGGVTPTFENVNTLVIVDDYLAAATVGQALGKCGYPCSGSQLNSIMQSTNLHLSGITAPDGWGFAPGRNTPTASVIMYHWSTADNKAEQVGGTYPLNLEPPK